MNINRRKEKLIVRLREKEHRDAYVSANIDIGITFQIRALREKRGWTQKELADLAGKKQAWIAKIESPNYSGFSLKTLKELASVFDVGLVVRYVPFGDMVKLELELSPERLRPPSFDEDAYFKVMPYEEYSTTQVQLLTPPVYTHFVSGVDVIGGGGAVNFINNTQELGELNTIKPVDELAKRRAAKQEETRSRLAKLMIGEQNETAIG